MGLPSFPVSRGVSQGTPGALAELPGEVDETLKICSWNLDRRKGTG